MTLPTVKKKFYRPAAGVVIFNPKGKVWLGHRKGEKTRYRWQFPQGGLDKGEKPLDGALREMFEETGIKAKHVVVIGQIEDELYYDFPAGVRKTKRGQTWRGQRQSWFAVRFLGKDKHVDLKSHGPQEFSSWKWGNLQDTPDLIVPFKRDVYERVAKEFARFAIAEE